MPWTQRTLLAAPEAMRGHCAVALVIAESAVGSLLVLVGALSIVGACALIFFGVSASLFLFWRFAQQPPTQVSQLTQPTNGRLTP